MKSATVRQIRDGFSTVLRWLEEGECVRISKRGKVVAVLSPPPRPKPVRGSKRPNFVARFKRIYGDKVLSGNIIIQERESRS